MLPLLASLLRHNAHGRHSGGWAAQAAYTVATRGVDCACALHLAIPSYLPSVPTCAEVKQTLIQTSPADFSKATPTCMRQGCAHCSIARALH